MNDPINAPVRPKSATKKGQPRKGAKIAKGKGARGKGTSRGR